MHSIVGVSARSQPCCRRELQFSGRGCRPGPRGRRYLSVRRRTRRRVRTREQRDAHIKESRAGRARTGRKGRRKRMDGVGGQLGRCAEYYSGSL